MLIEVLLLRDSILSCHIYQGEKLKIKFKFNSYVLTQCHQGEVGDCSIPNGNLNHLGTFPVSPWGQGDLLGAWGDLLDGSHEEVRYDRDPKEAVEKPDQVEGGPDPVRPGYLDEEGQHHGLTIGAAELVNFSITSIYSVARVILILTPGATQHFHFFRHDDLVLKPPCRH